MIPTRAIDYYRKRSNEKRPTRVERAVRSPTPVTTWTATCPGHSENVTAPSQS